MLSAKGCTCGNCICFLGTDGQLLRKRKSLKVVSATYVLVCFSSLNESNFQAKKNVFYFTPKALFVLEKIKF